MRKLIVFGALMALTAAVIGCGKKSAGESGSDNDSASGNPYEKMVQDFCAAAQKFSSALGMCGNELLGQLHLREGASFLQGSTGDDMPDARAFFAALTKAKDPVKTKVVKTVDLKDEDVQGAFVAATCGDVTIYFAVGREGKLETKKEVRIGGIIDKEGMEEKIRAIEEQEKREREAGRTRKERGGDDSDVQAARVETARLLIKNVEIALKMYNMKHGGKYPDSLDVLTMAPDDDSDPLLEGEPVDPWGNELMYEKRGRKLPLIRSVGPDGEFDTDDDLANQDLVKYRESNRESIRRKVEGATKAISEAIEEEEGTKAKDAVESLDEGKIKRLGE